MPKKQTLNTNIFRIISYFTKTEHGFKVDHLLTFALPVTMYVVGQNDVLVVLKLWLIVLAVTSFLISFIGTTSGHHHPLVYHDGDELP